MSWSRVIGLQACAALLVAGFALGSCGFHPLYGKANEEVVPQLASVKIESIADRKGQKLRNMLYTQLNPRGEPARPQYLLQTTLKEYSQALAIQIDEVATRANLLMDAAYTLTELRTGRILFKRGVRATTSYDIVQNEFADLSAQEDARTRALRQISDEIKTQLSFYFARQEPEAPQPAQVQAAPQ